MLNRVVLVGRLTKDPELRYTPSGVAVATFTLAVNRPFQNQQGEKEADFINCVVWRKQAENASNFLKKGSLAGVDGRVQTRNYEGQDGKRVFVTEVVAESVQFLEPKGSRDSQGQSSNQYGGQQSQGYNQNQRQQSNQYNGQQNQGYNPPTNNQRDFGRYDHDPNDPFANDGQPIDISDDDLPF